jgi:hypothetical protein
MCDCRCCGDPNGAAPVGLNICGCLRVVTAVVSVADARVSCVVLVLGDLP